MVLAAGSVGQETEGMRAVEEVQARVSRVDRVQREEWKVKKGWGSGNVMATVGRRGVLKRSQEGHTEAGVESSSRPKTSFSSIPTKGTLISFVKFKQDTNFQTIF